MIHKQRGIVKADKFGYFVEDPYYGYAWSGNFDIQALGFFVGDPVEFIILLEEGDFPEDYHNEISAIRALTPDR